MTAFSAPYGWLNHMPPEFHSYFWNNVAGGCGFDKKWTIINDMGLLKEVLIEPIPQYGERKFQNFLLDSWENKTIKEIPGIGNTFAFRMKANLGDYCSVRQLYHMFFYWMYDEAKFKRFLGWACIACRSNAGEWQMTRAVAAFKQKHLLFTDPFWTRMFIRIGDPNPFCEPEE